jgi:hypothetical protein
VQAVKKCLLISSSLCVLLVAYAGAYNVYYGNLHSHCNYSDGIGTPSEAFAYARDSALVDIQALTDHSHMLTAGEYSSLRSIAASYTEDGVFLAIAGQEHGSLSTTRTGAFGHMNFYEATTVIPQYDNGGDDYRYNLAGTYAWLLSHNDGISGEPLYGVFNHPYYTGGCGADAQFHHFAYSVTGDSAMSHTEIRNGQRADNYEPEYLEVLAKGWHVGVTANQDNHNGMWGDQPNPNMGGDIYLTGILADTLTKEAVLMSLKDRRTFGVEVNPKTDRMAILFQCEGHWMGDVFETALDTVSFDITVWAQTDFASLELIRNGTQVAWVGPGSNYYEWHPEDDPPMGESYYFVRAQQADGDYMWSSPIWVISMTEEWDAISYVNEDDAYGEPEHIYEPVNVRGLITVGTGTFSNVNTDVFVQDGTGGVNVYKSGSTTPSVSEGDSVIVYGTVDQYLGLTRIVLDSLTVAATGLDVPDPLLVTTGDISANGEIYEGLFIKVEGCSIISGTWPAEGVNGTVTIDDGSGGCTLFIDQDTDIDGSPEPTTEIDISGVVIQYDPSYPYWSGYRLAPRSLDDIDSSQAGIGDVAFGDGIISRILPNPARGHLRIIFGRAAAAGPKRVTFFDVTGRRVCEVAAEAGAEFVDWQATDSEGRPVPSGVYFASVETVVGCKSTKVVLIR